MSEAKAPLTPFPPDPGDDVEAPVVFGDLVDVVVENADWANTRAPGWHARRADLRLCRLTGAELAEATIADVTFDGCRLDLAGFRLAKLERVVFRDCRMGECDLLGATLQDVLFERCELARATVVDVKIKRVELRGCDLTAVQGVESLRGARMPWNDVLENGPLFAQALGIEIVD